MEVLVIALFWILTALVFAAGRKALLYFFFASLPFGALAVIPAELTGGLTLTPTPIVGVLVILRELGSARGLNLAMNWALRPSRLLLLTAFWICALVTTLFMPRLFAGMVNVVPVRTTAFMELVVLQPTSQNFSQMVYLTASVLSVFAFARMMRAPAMRLHAIQAMCLGAAITVATGLLDLASFYVPLDAFLDLFRTATYTLLTEAEVEGTKRVVGLTTEASDFGGMTLGFLASLYFFRRALPPGRLQRLVVPVLMALLLLMAWLSTSSAAYVGAAVLGATALAEWLWRLLAVRRNAHLRRGLTREFWLGVVALCAVLVVLLAFPRVLAPVLNMLDQMVLQKASTSSFDERNMWTRTAWEALWTTYGLGVGVGSTRSSNYAVALAANAGLLAAMLYFAFVVQTLRRRVPAADAQGRALLSAVRWSYLPPFVISLLIGASADFGPRNAFLYGFALAVACPARARVARLAKAKVGPVVRPFGSRPAPPAGPGIPVRGAHAG